MNLVEAASQHDGYVHIFREDRLDTMPTPDCDGCGGPVDLNDFYLYAHRAMDATLLFCQESCGERWRSFAPPRPTFVSGGRVSPR